MMPQKLLFIVNLNINSFFSGKIPLQSKSTLALKYLKQLHTSDAKLWEQKQNIPFFHPLHHKLLC